MDRRAVVGVIAYGALLGSLLTPIYDPLTAGRDDAWAIAAMVVLAHVAVGAAVRRSWVLLLPLMVSVAGFLSNGAGGFAVFWLVFAAPLLLCFTGAGRLLGRRFSSHAGYLTPALFAAAAVPLVWGTVETLRRGPHVPVSVQERLPIELSLGNLCAASITPPDVENDVRRRAEALIRELGRRPMDLVTYTYYSSDDPSERRDITVRELAEEQLKAMDSNGPDCDPALEERLRAALSGGN